MFSHSSFCLSSLFFHLSSGFVWFRKFSSAISISDIDSFNAVICRLLLFFFHFLHLLLLLTDYLFMFLIISFLISHSYYPFTLFIFSNSSRLLFLSLTYLYLSCSLLFIVLTELTFSLKTRLEAADDFTKFVLTSPDVASFSLMFDDLRWHAQETPGKN